MSEVLTGKEFKSQLRAGRPKMGLFLNAHSPTVAEQLAVSVPPVVAVRGPSGRAEPDRLEPVAERAPHRADEGGRRRRG